MANKIYEYRGDLYTISGLARLAGVDRATIWHRIRKQKMSVEDAVKRPKWKKNVLTSTPAPCGFTSMYDCLNCKYSKCISENYKAIPGETMHDLYFSDYGKR